MKRRKLIILCHAFGQVIAYRLAGTVATEFVYSCLHKVHFVKTNYFVVHCASADTVTVTVEIKCQWRLDCTQMPLLYSRCVLNNAVILHLYLLTPRTARAQTLSNKLFNQVYFTQSLIVTVCFFMYLN